MEAETPFEITISSPVMFLPYLISMDRSRPMISIDFFPMEVEPLSRSVSGLFSQVYRYQMLDRSRQTISIIWLVNAGKDLRH